MQAKQEENVAADAIAIIGISARMPQAADIESFWRNIAQGRECIVFFDDEQLRQAGVSEQQLQDPGYVKASPLLERIEMFDAAFFGYAPQEAQLMDPQHRLFLESAYHALEDAGYDSAQVEGNIGIFGGSSINTYLLNNLVHEPQLMQGAGLQMLVHGNSADYMVSRAAYKLNLRGPCLALQTACSSGLAALHTACQSLLNYQCDMALAGAVAVKTPELEGYQYQEGGIFSPDGHCRPFDARAQGTIFGSGCGVLVLKRASEAIADQDHIYALILASAMNNDGARKVGYAAPSVEGQAEVIAEALALADVPVESIAYLEAHGTGTVMGDPIEMAALQQAYGDLSAARQYCAIGSVKANIGHLNAAAGIAGLIKAVQALRHAQLPPAINFDTPNPAIDFANSPFYVNTSLRDWPQSPYPRRAAVSAFGIGGTNVHVILQQAPAPAPAQDSAGNQVLLLSAKTENALQAMQENLQAHLQQQPQLSLAALAHTLRQGRAHLPWRCALVARNVSEAAQALRDSDARKLARQHSQTPPPQAVFMFPGQGSQYLQMCAGLYREHARFKSELQRCADWLRQHADFDLLALLFAEGEPGAAAQRLQQTENTQVALFCVEYALAKIWLAAGLTPRAMIGHSIGEYVCATLSGVFQLEHALALVCARGRLLQALPAGQMLALACDLTQLHQALGDLAQAQLSLAAQNGERMLVLAGAPEAVAAAQPRLAQAGIECRLLHTSHAFHSHMVDVALPAFAEQLRRTPMGVAQLPWVSNLDGSMIEAGARLPDDYWLRHLRQSVQFKAGLDTLCANAPDGGLLLLEVGPGRNLSSLARAHPHAVRQHVLASCRHPQQNEDDMQTWLRSLSACWTLGLAPDWAQAGLDLSCSVRLPLPHYPFARQRHWLQVAKSAMPAAVLSPVHAAPGLPSALAEEGVDDSTALHPRPALATPYVAPENDLELTLVEIWRELLGFAQIGVRDNFFELGGHSLMATQLVSRLRETFPVQIEIASLFEEPTIARLAEYLEMKMIEQLENM